MGTWDIGFFDNDMACDWENSLKESKNLSKIAEPLEKVLSDNDDSLDIDLASKALAAAEALARLILKDGERNSYTVHLDEWVDQFNEVIPKELVENAIEAIKKVSSPTSELNLFWKLRGEHPTWSELVNNLTKRLELGITRI